MSDRIPLDDLTSDALDALYERAETSEQLTQRLAHALAAEFDTTIDTVLDDLVAAAGRQTFPIASHPYKGFGFEAPCTAAGFGTACGATEYDHTEKA